MATRSTIAIENLDGTIHQVYCHWDGYISNNGELLQKFYNTRESVEKLVSKGGISSLGEYVSDEQRDFNRLLDDDYYTVFYTYRGEITEIRHFKDFDDYEKNHQYEEYSYLYNKDNTWSVFIDSKNDWFDLEYLLIEEGLIEQNGNND